MNFSETKQNLPSSPQRRSFLQTSVLGGMSAGLLPALAGAHVLAAAAPDTPPFELDEMTIADLQAGMSSGKFTARQILLSDRTGSECPQENSLPVRSLRSI